MKMSVALFLALGSTLVLAGQLPEGLVKQIIATEYQGKAPKNPDKPIEAWPNQIVTVREDGTKVFGIWMFDTELTGLVGSAGPEMMFYLEEHGHYRKATAATYPCDTFAAIKSKTYGLSDLRITHKYKSLPTEIHLLKFDGTDYKEVGKKGAKRP